MRTLCLQVLEELEKVKGHCKDYEAKNNALLTEKEALEQHLKVEIPVCAVNEYYMIE